MPVVRSIRDRFASERPLDGRLVACHYSERLLEGQAG